MQCVHLMPSASQVAPLVLRENDYVRRVEIDQAAACQFLEATIAAVFRVSISELRGPTRGRASIAFARQVAMYTAHVTLGLSLTEVGRQFGRDRTTAAHACRLVEDRRDEPRVDRCLAAIESAFMSWQRETVPQLRLWS